MNQVKQPRRFSWKLFWLLFAMGILGALGSIPFALELARPIIETAEMPSVPLPLLVLAGAVQNLTILAAMVFVGLKLGPKLGLGAPLLQGWLSGTTAANEFKASLKRGLISGIAVGVVLTIALLALVPLLPNLPFASAAKLAIWKRVLICFYGGLFEEILARLFLLSLVAWIANKLLKSADASLAPGAFWFANVFVAILFGLGHLPSASLVMPITPLVVAAALILNGIAAVVFGVLYRKNGLESAMIAHFSADFIIFVVGPAFVP